MLARQVDGELESKRQESGGYTQSFATTVGGGGVKLCAAVRSPPQTRPMNFPGTSRAKPCPRRDISPAAVATNLVPSFHLLPPFGALCYNQVAAIRPGPHNTSSVCTR